MPPAESNDLVLTGGQFSLLRDNTKGVVYTLVGPMVHTRSGTSETPVAWNPNTRDYVEVDARTSVQRLVTARRNEYVRLQNPAVNDKNANPSTGSKQIAQDLMVGEEVVRHGPCTFALWPGQSAEVVPGHALRSNEYLVIEIVDEEAAGKNWSKSVLKKTATVVSTVRTELQPDAQGVITPDAPTTDVVQPASIATSEAPSDLAVGAQYLIKGDEVRFYMPGTGVRVLQDDNGAYVRQAQTLEILEYAILLDEDGTKSFPRGPCVVFPKPTQRFLSTEDGKRAFRPIELNEIQGLHLKALTKHTFLGVEYGEGDEFFLTGKQCKLYYPQPNHASVKYDGKAQHYAVCLPEGDTRYLLDRKTGEVELVKGPTMLLPNAVTEVIVRRVLTHRQCELWYPGNAEAAEYNSALRAQAAQTPTTRTGVSDGQADRARIRGGGDAPLEAMRSTTSSMMETSRQSGRQQMVGEEISRSSTFNAPRTVTMNDKFSGAPVIQPWPGYAAMVVGKDGSRKVVVHGERHYLEYHEELQAFTFSTGRPKSGKNRKSDVYLRAANNAVRDEITVITKDHVPVKIYVSFRVGFEGTTQEEMQQWWTVEDYVKFLVDHIRSKAQAEVRMMSLTEFYAQPAAAVRDIVLGKMPVVAEGVAAAAPVRPGLFFKENRLRVYDVDVLEVTIADPTVQAALAATALKVVTTELTLAQQTTAVKAQTALTELSLQELALKEKTATAQHEAAVAARRRQTEIYEIDRDSRAESAAFELEQEKDRVESEMELDALRRKSEEEDKKVEVAHAKAMSEIETAEVQARAAAVGDKLADAITALGDKRVLVDVANATAVQRLMTGSDLSSALKTLVGDDAGGAVDALARRITTVVSPQQ